MEFFRKNQKLIVGIIAVAFLLFMFAPILIEFVAGKQ